MAWLRFRHHSADFPGLDKFPGKEQNFYRRIKSETTRNSLRGCPARRSLKLRGFMASPLICSQAAMNHPIVFVPEERSALLLNRLSALPKFTGVTAASRLEMRPAPKMVSTGIHAMDALTGGLPRGCLTEIFGPASSGRSSVLLAALAAATQRQEVCALVDVTNAFDPQSAAAARVVLDRLLWVRCGHEREGEGQERKRHEWEGHDFSRANKTSLRAGALAPQKKVEGPVEQALRVTDLLLQS